MMIGLYRFGTTLMVPFVERVLAKRLARGKEDPDRLDERRGIASETRPEGSLVWLHAASVGESLSLLALVDRLRADRPDLNLLVTTGTVTSARLMGSRLPVDVVHHFVPVDRVTWVRRFLDHWKPDAAIWIESEIWPNLVHETARRGVPMALVNGRMSDRSFRRWRWANGFAKALIGAFEVCLAQDGDHLRRFQALGISWAATAGNLKFAAAPLPVDEEERTAVTEALDGRAVWLAASTHPGEEDIAGAVHLAARRDHPRLLTIIAPRHPERAERIINALAPRGLQISQRSTGDAIAADTDIYLADTIGEMGLLYRLCDVVFVGGSLVPHGGHNPLEPAKLGAAIITGPHMENFADIARQMSACEGVSTVADQTALARVVTQTLADGSLRNRLKAAAADVVEAQKGVLDDLMRHLEPVLPKSDNR